MIEKGLTNISSKKNKQIKSLSIHLQKKNNIQAPDRSGFTDGIGPP